MLLTTCSLQMACPSRLEVGRIRVAITNADRVNQTELHLPWNRAHFGAWCVVSAPLILGLDLTDNDVLTAVMPIISNGEALEVNQAWAGHPGRLIWSTLVGVHGYPAARRCNASDSSLKQAGWAWKPLATVDDASASPERTRDTKRVALMSPIPGGCLERRGGGARGGAGGLVIGECDGSDAQAFTYDETSQQLAASGHCVDVHNGGPIVWMYGRSVGPHDRLTLNTSAGGTLSVPLGTAGLCFGVEDEDPAGSTYVATLQAWAKPLPAEKGVALLLINPTDDAHTVELPLSALPLTGNGLNLSTTSFGVRDIWANAHWDQDNVAQAVRRADSPTALADSAHTTSPDDSLVGSEARTIKLSVGGLDSVFLRLFPTTS